MLIRWKAEGVHMVRKRLGTPDLDNRFILKYGLWE